MKEKQNTTGSIASAEQLESKENKICITSVNSSIYDSRSVMNSGELTVREKSVSKTGKKGMMKYLQEEISNIYSDLNAICAIVERVEEENMELLFTVLYVDSPKRYPINYIRTTSNSIN